jgi:hypothetical protein
MVGIKNMESKGEIIIYQVSENENKIEVRLAGETVWLSQRLMADLFEKDSDTVGLHLKNIFSEGELDEKATTEFFSVVQKEGSRNVTRKIKFYNLDAIISVGYRVNSKRGTQFRQFADGNKRIASFLFVYFLDRNNYLFRESGERKINDNALTALALLIAVSDAKEKEKMIKIITNLIAI